MRSRRSIEMVAIMPSLARAHKSPAATINVRYEKRKLALAGLSVPAAPNVLAPGNPAVNVFILPDNTNPGMLEDLCLASVQGQAAYSCLDSYFQCTSAAG